MDTLDDLLNDLNAIAHELGTDQPSPVSTSSSSGSRDTKNSSEGSHITATVSAESGFSSHNSSNYDFPTIKKAPIPPPPPVNAPNLDAEFDSIMSQLSTLDGKLEADNTEYVQPSSALQTKQPVIQTAKRVSFKSGTDAPPIPSKPKSLKSSITSSNSSYGSSSNSNGPVRLPFSEHSQVTPPSTLTKPVPPVRPRPSIPKPHFGEGGAHEVHNLNNNTYTVGPAVIRNDLPQKRAPETPQRALRHQPMPPPSPSLPPPAQLTPQCTLSRDGEVQLPTEGKYIPPPPPGNNYLPPPTTTDVTQVSNLLEKIQGVAVYCDKHSDGEDHYPIPPCMSLSRNSTVLHSDLRQAQCVGNKCSPAFSVNTEISRDSGFSTDNSITFEKSVYIIAPPPPPPYVITTPKCPTLPIAKSQSMSSGYQSNETTPTNQYESAERIRIFSSEGSYKLLPVERNMSTRYVTQLVAEKHRTRLAARHSLLEYNPDLGTERVLEEHEKVCEVVGHWGQTNKNELHFLERKDKWLLFSHPQVLMDRKTAQHQPTREERQKILYQWFPDPGGFRYPGWDGRFISDTIHLKSDPKDKWIKKYIELRENKILIFKKESAREKQPEEMIDLSEMLFYRGVGWKQRFKAPTENGFVVKLPHIQKMNKNSNLTERVKFFAVEDELSELKWVTALRLAKMGRQLIENYQNTLSTVEQRPSSLLSLRPASFGPLPTVSGNSRPSSIEQDQFDGMPRDYQPEMGNRLQMNPPNIPEGVVLRGNRQLPPMQRQAAPMTRFYMEQTTDNDQHLRMTPSDFPPPPPFIYQLKDLSRHIMQSSNRVPHQQNVQARPNFELPPPPPELMVQAAKSYKTPSGYPPVVPSPRSRPPPPPRIFK